MAKRSAKTGKPSKPSLRLVEKPDAPARPAPERSAPERPAPERSAPERPAPARSAPDVHRKLIAFDAETWHALTLLGKDTFMTFQELADEAFRDLLRKHGRPVDLREQLKRSLRKPDEK